MPGLKKFSNVDVIDIESVSSASSIARIDDVDLFGLPLILRLTIANDGDSWDPTVQMNNGTGVIDWGDGTPTEPVSVVDLPPHTYSTAGTYDVTLSPFKGSLTRTIGVSIIGTPDTQVTEVLAFGDCGNVGFNNWKALVTIPLNGYLDLTGVVFFQSSIFRECSAFVGPTSMSGYANLNATPALQLIFDEVPLFNRPGLNDLDTSSVTSFIQSFANASSFDQPLDNWVVSLVSNMNAMFRGASSFNQDISGWDVGLVEDMASMFNGASSFNQDIGGWDVSSVGSMGAMFRGASSFNQDISGWDVSGVDNIAAMFAEASSFDQPLNSWDVSGVRFMGVMFKDTPFDQPLNNWVVSSAENMASMFAGASSFNQDIGGWDVSSVKSIRRMFAEASSFNQPLNSWDVSAVTNMESAFRVATSFNQDISGWDISGVDTLKDMFNGANSFDQNLGAWQFKNNADASFLFDSTGISDANVALCLEGWDSIGQGTGVDMSNMVIRTLSESTYPNAKTAYDNLIATYSWDLTNSITWVA